MKNVMNSLRHSILCKRVRIWSDSENWSIHLWFNIHVLNQRTGDLNLWLSVKVMRYNTKKRKWTDKFIYSWTCMCYTKCCGWPWHWSWRQSHLTPRSGIQWDWHIYNGWFTCYKEGYRGRLILSLSFVHQEADVQWNWQKESRVITNATEDGWPWHWALRQGHFTPRGWSAMKLTYTFNMKHTSAISNATEDRNLDLASRSQNL